MLEQMDELFQNHWSTIYEDKNDNYRVFISVSIRDTHVFTRKYNEFVLL